MRWQWDGTFWDGVTPRLILNLRLPAYQQNLLTETFDTFFPQLEHHLVLATSGSSGMPKLVALSLRALLCSAASVNRALELSPSDKWLRLLPCYHVGGLAIHFRTQLAGAGVVEACSEKWNAEAAYRKLCNTKCTIVSLVPTQLFDWVQLNFCAPTTLRFLLMGGAALSEDVLQKALALGWPVHTSYGMTECCSTVALMNPSNPKEMRPLDHIQCRESGGKLAIQSDALLSSYLIPGSDQQPARRLDPKQEKWFITSDHVKFNQGNFVVFGRDSEVIKMGGELVSMLNLNQILQKCIQEEKANVDAVLLSLPEPRKGNCIYLLCASEDKSVAEKLKSSFNDRVAPYERIFEVKLSKKIPRSSLGKLLIAEAMQILQASDAG